MNRLYIDASMGAAGDMLTASLVDLFEDKEKIVEELNAIDIPHVQYVLSESVKCGITGSHISVLVHGEEEGNEHHHEHHHEHEHHHSSLHDIEHIVYDHLNLSDKVKKDVMDVYRLIAEAESHAHGCPVHEIHFHEVGTMDAIADVTAVSYLIDKLKVEDIITSPVHVGYGSVKCAHGILPIPAPATAFILQGVPTYSTEIKGELCTPTGAALLKHFSTSFGPMPIMTVDKIGYGMGNKDFERANCVRLLLSHSSSELSDSIIELMCQVDDMTGEELGYALDAILSSGAVDVYYTNISMKKNRPGVLITTLVKEDMLEQVVKAIFSNTTTIGIRQCIKSRYILKREMIEKDGTRYKRSSGYGTERCKPEFEDLVKKAKAEGKSLLEVKNSL